MDLLHQALALIVTLGLLVTFHEYGHFWVARKCGVKVLRFSVGFGKPIFTWKDKRGTEFAIASIPLGGYVKMLDEREGPVAEEELSVAFNRKTVWQRIAIVAAGPIANFIFAFIAYWAIAVSGVHSVAPIVGAVTEGSIAESAGLKPGDEIVSVGGEETASWQSVVLSLAGFLGDSGQIDLSVKNVDEGFTRPITLTIQDWLQGEERPELIHSLGVTPYRPPLKAVIAELSPGKPAQKAGLLAGDQVIEIDGKSVTEWKDLVDVVQVSAGKSLQMVVLRDEKREQYAVTPEHFTQEDGTVVGLVGARVKPAKWPDEYVRIVKKGPLDAISTGAEKTWSMIKLTLGAVKKLIVGDISLKTLSGPITIAQIAEESVSSGVESFLHFLAYLSVSLGVLNLLPIPVLDGGHLVYYLAEVLRGKPLSDKVQMLGLKVGVALILFMMTIAFYNDLARLF